MSRFKKASNLNIIDLPSAFAAFIVIIIQVDYETNFDTSYKKSGRIFRIEHTTGRISYSPLVSRPLVEGLTNDLAQIESGARMAPFGEQQYIGKIIAQQECANQDGVRNVIEVSGVYRDFFRLKLPAQAPSSMRCMPTWEMKIEQVGATKATTPMWRSERVPACKSWRGR